jgi:methionyl-tRNA formyltransferase
VRIVFAGTPAVAVPSLDALLASSHEVVAVVTRPDAPSGRGRSLHASPVGVHAEALGIESLKPNKPRDEDFVRRLTEIAPDCCPVVAYGAMLPERVLGMPPHGWVNLHFSLLPRWRGAAPVQHAILAGDEITGATTFRIVRELDAGPVYSRVTEAIRPTDTSGELLGRLAIRGAELLVETLNDVAAGRQPTAQPEAEVTYASKINVEDAQIDWTRTAAEVDRQIRGCAPAPGAWTTFRGERFKISSAALDSARLEPGRLEVTKQAVRVGTADGSLLLGDVQAQGKKPMRAADWARGVAFTPFDAFGG